MSEIIEAVRGAMVLVFSGFVLIVFAEALADTTLHTEAIGFGLLGILAIVGAGIVLATTIAALIGGLFK